MPHSRRHWLAPALQPPRTAAALISIRDPGTQSSWRIDYHKTFPNHIMPLRFYNTLTQQVQPFSPIHADAVRMYTCGPTVYDFAHIGNFRTFVFYDLLRRALRLNGYK